MMIIPDIKCLDISQYANETNDEEFLLREIFTCLENNNILSDKKAIKHTKYTNFQNLISSN